MPCPSHFAGIFMVIQDFQDFQVLLAINDGEGAVQVELSNVTGPEESHSLDGDPILLRSQEKLRSC